MGKYTSGMFIIVRTESTFSQTQNINTNSDKNTGKLYKSCQNLGEILANSKEER